MNFVFVYGLLMQNSNAELSTYLKSNALFIGNGCTLGVLYDIGSYPGAIFNEKCDTWIFGEIYKINADKEKILTVLDDYEECSSNYSEPFEYRRLRINILKTSTSKLLQCFAYQYNWPIDNKRIIQSGNYMQYIGIKQKKKKYNIKLIFSICPNSIMGA